MKLFEVKLLYVYSIVTVRLFPCDNKPCLNGATCANDDEDVSLYHCHCTDGYSGKNCQGRKKNSHLSNVFCIVSAQMLIMVVLGWLIDKDMSSLPSSYLQQNCLL